MERNIKIDGGLKKDGNNLRANACCYTNWHPIAVGIHILVYVIVYIYIYIYIYIYHT